MSSRDLKAVPAQTTADDIEPTDSPTGSQGGQATPELVSDSRLVLVPSCTPPQAVQVVTATLQSISAARQKPLFALIADFIDQDVLAEVYRWRNEISDVASKRNVDILVDSPGGNLTSCYLLARLLARATDSWEALVPTLAASGATLICLGSSKIVMSGIAQLGPLDPQVLSKRREKFFAAERQSPLEAFQAVQYLRELALSTIDAGMHFLQAPHRGVAPQRALDTATQFATQFVRPVLERIEPYDLGAFALDNALALQYCRRVAQPPSPTKQTQRQAQYKDLVERYPAHEFAVDLEEARALGLSVAEPSEAVDRLFDELRQTLEQVKTYIGMVPPPSQEAP